MRLKKMKEEKIISSFPFGIAESYIGNGYPANTFFILKSWAITSEIEKITRLSRSGQFLSPILSLQFVQDRTPNIIYIYPRPKGGKDIRLVQFWYRFLHPESTNSHFLSLQ
jgi:hypothetical protein